MEINEKKGIGKGNNPKSHKNLVPVKPGQVLNPNGARGQDRQMRMLRQLSHQTVKDIVELGLTGTLAELKEIVEDDTAPALRRGFAKIIGDAVVNGNLDVIDRLLDRLIGRVPVVIENNIKENPPQTEEEIKERTEFLREKMRKLALLDGR